MGFGMEFPSVAETHFDLLFDIIPRLVNEMTMAGIDNLDESATPTDNAVTNFAADGVFLSQWQVFVVAEIAVLSLIHI